MACEGTCKKCNSKSDGVKIQTIRYNTVGYYPDDIVEIGVTVKNENFLLSSNTCLCLIDESGTSLGIIYRELNAGEIWSPSFPTFTMGSVNRNLHISVISGFLADFVDCTDYRNFPVKSIASPGRGWSCNPQTRSCYEDSASTKTYDQCDRECRGSGNGGGGDIIGCDPACSGDSVCLLGSCIKRNDIFIFGVGILAFMYLSKKG